MFSTAKSLLHFHGESAPAAADVDSATGHKYYQLHDKYVFIPAPQTAAGLSATSRSASAQNQRMDEFEAFRKCFVDNVVAADVPAQGVYATHVAALKLNEAVLDGAPLAQRN